MKWKDIISIGVRNLTARRSRSILTIGGVGVGIAAVIFLVSIGYGLQQLAIRDALQSKSLSFLDVLISTSGPTSISTELITKIKSINGVANVYPQLETPAKLTIPNIDTKADIILFLNDTVFSKQSDVRVLSGRMYADDADEVVVSSALLKLLGIEADKAMNSRVTFSPLLRDEFRVRTDAVPDITFTVVGITDDEETPFLVAPIKPVTEITGELAYSDLKVEAQDEDEIATLRTAIEDLGLETEYIGDTVAQLNSIFSVIRTVLAGFGLVATFVAALGMFNTLSVSLLERTREIGIMKTLGTKRRDVSRLFLIEGILISVSGGIVGIVLGVLFGEGINLIFNIVARATGNNGVDFYYSPPIFLLLIMVLVTILGVIVGFFPARRATKISPLSALRYE